MKVKLASKSKRVKHIKTLKLISQNNAKHKVYREYSNTSLNLRWICNSRFSLCLFDNTERYVIQLGFF